MTVRSRLPALILALGAMAIPAPADAGPGGARFETLWSFSAPLGAQPPDAALFPASKGGALYGTTLYGGAHRRGSVFELAPPVAPGGPWRMKVLWSFAGKDGAYARPGLIDRAPDGRVRAGAGRPPWVWRTSSPPQTEPVRPGR